MSDIVLIAIALLLCCVLLWLRIRALALTVRFRVFRGTVHAAGGIGAFVADPVSGSLVPRLKRFSLRGAGFDLGDLSAHDAALAVAAGNTVSAVYAECRAMAPQPALLFNHENARWRCIPGAWASLRGDAASHYLPVLVFFAMICLVWMGTSANAAAPVPELSWLLGIDLTIVSLAGIVLAVTAFVLLTTAWLRSLDDELERRAIKALRNALFALPEDDRARRAAFNLAAPRTRRAPYTPDLIRI